MNFGHSSYYAGCNLNGYGFFDFSVPPPPPPLPFDARQYYYQSCDEYRFRRPVWNDPRDNCVFCRIYDRKERNFILYQDDYFVVFDDHRPVARNHVLVVTRQHFPDVTVLTREHIPTVERLVELGKHILQQRGANLRDSRFGFHMPPKNSVKHLHLHVISPASTLSSGEKKRFGLSTWFFLPADVLLQNLYSL